MGWFSNLFGGGEEKPEEKVDTDLPAPLPKELPQAAPVTPMSVLKADEETEDVDDEDTGAWEEDDGDGMTIVPGPDSDIAETIRALREEVAAEKLAEEASE